MYAPGEVFADLAATVADGADCIDAVGQPAVIVSTHPALFDREKLAVSAYAR